MERLEDISGEDIIYFSICYEEEVLRPFYEYLKKDERLNLNFYKDVYGDGLWYLEISHKNASKYYKGLRIKCPVDEIFKNSVQMKLLTDGSCFSSLEEKELFEDRLGSVLLEVQRTRLI